MNADFPEKLEFLFKPARFKVAYGGRAGAKSWAFARALLIEGAKRPLRVLCARETQESLADSVHRLLEDQVKALGLDSYYDVGKALISGRNGTQFAFAGIKHNVAKIKSYEGFDIVWVEEGQSVTKESWDIVIPTFRKEGSEVWVSFNPKSDVDDTYKRFVLDPPPGAVVVKVNYTDNPWFPEVLRPEVEHLRRTDPAGYTHIWLGEPLGSVEGAVFGEELEKAKDEGRICSVPYDHTKPVDTAWDLGYGDLTAIWFVQAYGGYFNFIDCLAGFGKTIADYLIKLQNRGYLYGRDFLPHDAVDAIIHAKLGGDKTKSIEMLLRAAGRNVRVVPKLYVVDAINAARTMLPQCRFDETKCADGLHALRNYQWGPLDKNGVHKREPLHNWASHYADAFRGACVAIKHPEAARPVVKPPTPQPQGSRAWMG